jgi:hypothetical protein
MGCGDVNWQRDFLRSESYEGFGPATSVAKHDVGGEVNH